MEILIYGFILFGTPIAGFVAFIVFLGRIGSIEEENKKLPPQERRSKLRETVLCIVSAVITVSFIVFDIVIIWSLNEMVKHM